MTHSNKLKQVVSKTIKLKIGKLKKGKQKSIDLALTNSLNIRKKFFEAISFKETASINNAVGFSFTESQTMINGRAEKYAKKEDVSPLTTKVMSIRNAYIL